jgi:hypothetical protein
MKKKRILSLLIAITMMLGIIPTVPVIADDPTPVWSPNLTGASVTSGTATTRQYLQNAENQTLGMILSSSATQPNGFAIDGDVLRHTNGGSDRRINIIVAGTGSGSPSSAEAGFAAEDGKRYRIALTAENEARTGSANISFRDNTNIVPPTASSGTTFSYDFTYDPASLTDGSVRDGTHGVVAIAIVATGPTGTVVNLSNIRIYEVTDYVPPVVCDDCGADENTGIAWALDYSSLPAQAGGDGGRNQLGTTGIQKISSSGVGSITFTPGDDFFTWAPTSGTAIEFLRTAAGFTPKQGVEYILSFEAESDKEGTRVRGQVNGADAAGLANLDWLNLPTTKGLVGFKWTESGTQAMRINSGLDEEGGATYPFAVKIYNLKVTTTCCGEDIEFPCDCGTCDDCNPPCPHETRVPANCTMCTCGQTGLAQTCVAPDLCGFHAQGPACEHSTRLASNCGVCTECGATALGRTCLVESPCMIHQGGTVGPIEGSHSIQLVARHGDEKPGAWYDAPGGCPTGSPISLHGEDGCMRAGGNPAGCWLNNADSWWEPTSQLRRSAALTINADGPQSLEITGISDINFLSLGILSTNGTFAETNPFSGSTAAPASWDGSITVEVTSVTINGTTTPVFTPATANATQDLVVREAADAHLNGHTNIGLWNAFYPTDNILTGITAVNIGENNSPGFRFGGAEAPTTSIRVNFTVDGLTALFTGSGWTQCADNTCVASTANCTVCNVCGFVGLTVPCAEPTLCKFHDSGTLPPCLHPEASRLPANCTVCVACGVENLAQICTTPLCAHHAANPPCPHTTRSNADCRNCAMTGCTETGLAQTCTAGNLCGFHSIGVCPHTTRSDADCRNCAMDGCTATGLGRTCPPGANACGFHGTTICTHTAADRTDADCRICTCGETGLAQACTTASPCGAHTIGSCLHTARQEADCRNCAEPGCTTVGLNRNCPPSSPCTFHAPCTHATRSTADCRNCATCDATALEPNCADPNLCEWHTPGDAPELLLNLRARLINDQDWLWANDSSPQNPPWPQPENPALSPDNLVSDTIKISGNGPAKATLNVQAPFNTNRHIVSLALNSYGVSLRDWVGPEAEKAHERFEDAIVKIDSVLINGAPVNIDASKNEGYLVYSVIDDLDFKHMEGFASFGLWNAYSADSRRISAGAGMSIETLEGAPFLISTAPITTIEFNFTVSNVHAYGDCEHENRVSTDCRLCVDCSATGLEGQFCDPANPCLFHNSGNCTHPVRQTANCTLCTTCTTTGLNKTCSDTAPCNFHNCGHANRTTADCRVCSDCGATGLTTQQCQAPNLCTFHDGGGGLTPFHKGDVTNTGRIEIGDVLEVLKLLARIKNNVLEQGFTRGGHVEPGGPGSRPWVAAQILPTSKATPETRPTIGDVLEMLKVLARIPTSNLGQPVPPEPVSWT